MSAFAGRPRFFAGKAASASRAAAATTGRKKVMIDLLRAALASASVSGALREPFGGIEPVLD